MYMKRADCMGKSSHMEQPRSLHPYESPVAACPRSQRLCALCRQLFHVALCLVWLCGRWEVGKPECKSGHPARVGYSDTARATGVAMRRTRTLAWVVWGVCPSSGL